MGVRWDAVVQDRGFWSDPACPPPEAPVADANRRVPIWLFGSLADGSGERPIAVEFRGAFSAVDVIAEVGRRCGRIFLDRVTDAGGAVFRNCRVFVNGQPVESTTEPIRTDPMRTDIELILLTAAEGG